MSSEVPEGWSVSSLGEVSLGKGEYGANVSKAEFDPKLPRYIRITDISDQGDLIPTSLVSISHEAAAGYLLEEGDLLFARSGATVGKSCLYQSSYGSCAFAGYLIRFRLDPMKIEPYFARSAVQSSDYWDWVATVQRAQAQPNINAKEYAALPLMLPPLDEQRRIAEVLRSVDEAIAANGDAVEQLRISRDAIRDEHFRASGMDSYARTLGSVCDITKLAGFEYSKHIRYGESDEIIAVRGLNMKDGELSLDDVKTISRATSQALPRSALRKGDLVMSYVGTIGEVAMIDADDRYHLAPNVALLRCGEQALPAYILHFLYSRTGREQINKYVSTSSQQSLSMGKIRSFEIDLPVIAHVVGKKVLRGESGSDSPCGWPHPRFMF